MTEPKSNTALVEVTLDKAHTHDGIAYAAGATLTVSPAERDWLLAQQVIVDRKEKK